MMFHAAVMRQRARDSSVHHEIARWRLKDPGGSYSKLAGYKGATSVPAGRACKAPLISKELREIDEPATRTLHGNSPNLIIFRAMRIVGLDCP
jgi:hypothetical protein